MTLLWPNGSTTIPHVSSEFNLTRKHPITGVVKPHRGIDLTGWSTIVAPVSGVVTVNAYQAGGAGHWVEVRADNGDRFRFFHLAAASPLHVGQRVTSGTAIGQMGASGSATGVHLHYETWPAGKTAINPREYYANNQENDMPLNNQDLISILTAKFTLTQNGKSREVSVQEMLSAIVFYGDVLNAKIDRLATAPVDTAELARKIVVELVKETA
ncbi:MAG: M23 family metallopeptidase [Aeromicrobium sp.]|uniref:M23 family metallopeptidase n=1 Tax=Aeromicrobium sp. TaxID=1871063 RepID=UPI0039E432AB